MSGKDEMMRTDSTQAMQTLFMAYAEDEEGGEETSGTAPAFEISGSEDEGTPQPAEEVKKRPVLDVDLSEEEEVKKPKLEKKRTATRLVSYGPDEQDEEGEEEEETQTLELEDPAAETESKLTDDESLAQARDTQTFASQEPTDLVEDTDDIKLPPEPPGKCSNKLQEKITKLYEKMKYRNLDMNFTIQSRKDFRNPSIYEKLIDYCGINEKGTNYPPELYDPSIWGKESYYDALARAQKEEMDKREKERKDRTKIEFVTVTKKPTEGGSEPKRKTKWDTQPATSVSAKPATVAPASLANPTVVSVTQASGTKTTVISAMGTLKKPK